MTLSDHEQRVLQEIESQFTYAEDCRWCLLRARLRRRWRALVCLVVALLACLLVEVLLPDHLVALIGIGAGLLAGAAAAFLLRRRVFIP